MARDSAAVRAELRAVERAELDAAMDRVARHEALRLRNEYRGVDPDPDLWRPEVLGPAWEALPDTEAAAWARVVRAARTVLR